MCIFRRETIGVEMLSRLWEHGRAFWRDVNARTSMFCPSQGQEWREEWDGGGVARLRQQRNGAGSGQRQARVGRRQGFPEPQLSALPSET